MKHLIHLFLSRQKEILATKPSFFYVEDNVYHEEGVVEAMDVYAKEVAIGFSIWIIDDSDYYRAGGNEWLPIAKESQQRGKKITTQQLFDLYIIQSKTK